MSTLPHPPTLEVVLQGLHESEIRCGIQNDPPAGGITAWVDFGSRTEKATFYGTIVGNRQVWPAADRIAAWLHETALRLFPAGESKSFISPPTRRLPSPHSRSKVQCRGGLRPWPHAQNGQSGPARLGALVQALEAASRSSRNRRERVRGRSYVRPTLRPGLLVV